MMKECQRKRWWRFVRLACLGAVGWAAAKTYGVAVDQDPAVIPFEFVRGHIMIPASVDDGPPLSFMLDTGYSIAMMNAEQVKTLQLKRVGQTTIVGIAGEEAADVFEGPTLRFSGATFSPRRVAAFPAGGRRNRSAILGSDFFRRFVVIIDHQGKSVRLHEPDGYKYTGSGEILPLTFRRSTPVVEAALNFPDRPAVRARFEVDTGCDGGLCLGQEFVATNKLIESAGQTGDGSRRGVGGGTRTRSGKVPQLQLGRLTMDNPDANCFLEGSPVDADLAGHIGIEILRRFRVIFDYSRRQMILEPYPPELDKRDLKVSPGEGQK